VPAATASPGTPDAATAAPQPGPGLASPPPPPSGYAPRPAEPGAVPGDEDEPAPAASQAGQPGEPAQTGGADPRLLSPVVRRLLEDNGISPSDVTGTGLGGRITREDVLTLLDARHAGQGTEAPGRVGPPVAPPVSPAVPGPPSTGDGRASAPTASASPAPGGQVAPPAPPTGATPPPPGAITAASSAGTALMRPSGDRVVPFSNMRRRTAEHMVRSRATSAHAFIAYEADFENVERVRKVWSPRFVAEEGFSLTYLPFIARATVEALREFPNLNSSVVDDSLVVHQEINLGVAVDLHHEGLIVPVVHRAEEVTLRGIARRVRDLAERARARQLTADDIAGGTFSITNDGPFGTYFTVPIINQPQVAILATDGIRRRPVVVTLPDGSESIAIHSVGVIGVSWDHRAVDGAYVSSFLQRVADVLAGRDWVAEL
jgi:pyruvate dehydrogenase E2 component (dihydrolipoamide acetyltransferase)